MKEVLVNEIRDRIKELESFGGFSNVDWHLWLEALIETIYKVSE